MARTVTEWQGRTDDTPPSDKCKLRILARQNDCCAISGRPFTSKEKPEFDHKTPLWLGGRNCESNLQAIHGDVHKRKTQAEAKVRAKSDRLRVRRLLGKKKSSLSHPSLKKRMDGSVVDRRTGEVIR